MFTDPDFYRTRTKDIKVSKCHLANTLMRSVQVLLLLQVVKS